MNKKIKCAACVIALSALLTGCKSEVALEENLIREISRFSNLCNNGELYMDNDKAVFYDFTSMTSSPLCSKPNCPHNSEKVCSAYNMYGVPFIYGDKVYYFVSDAINDGNGNFSDITELYSSDFDGTNRSVETTFENLCIDEATGMFMVGNELYLFSLKRNFSEYGGFGSEQTKEVHFSKLNLSDYSITELALLGTDYSSSGYFLGVFDNSIYFSYSYLDSPNELLNNPDFKHKGYKYDLRSEEIDQCNTDDIFMISGGWTVTKSDSGCVIKNENGEEITLNENYNDFDSIVNDIAFSGYYGYCINLSDGKRYKLNFTDDNSSRYSIRDYIDGKYIVMTENYAENSRDYISFAEDELIGEEII